MLKNRAGIIACALAFGASAVSAAQAADLRSPAGGNHAAPVARLNGLANLGHEGSGLVGHKRRVQRTAELTYNVFANLGHEGSGLAAASEVRALRPWAN